MAIQQVGPRLLRTLAAVFLIPVRMAAHEVVTVYLRVRTNGSLQVPATLVRAGFLEGRSVRVAWSRVGNEFNNFLQRDNLFPSLVAVT